MAYTGSKYIEDDFLSIARGHIKHASSIHKFGAVSAFRVGHSFEVSGTGGQYNYEFAVPIQLPAKTDIDVRARVRSNNARITAAFDIILFQGKS